MRVLLVYLGRMNAGPVYSLEIAKSLSNKCDLSCLISKNVVNKNQWYANKLNIIEIETYDNNFEFIRSTLKIKKFLELKKKVDEVKPDVIYITMIHYWLPILRVLFRKYKFVYTAHDPIPHSGENILNKFINYLMLKKSDSIVVLSNIYVNYIKKLGKKDKDILVVPHGNFSYYTQFSNNEFLNKSYKKIILFFGRIDKYKGINRLINIYKEVKKDYSECELWIVGNGDLSPYIDYINEQEDIKVVNRYIEDEEVSNYFNIADIILLPYEDATQSGVIPLAYSFSKPVIASDVGGLHEQIINGVTGYLFNKDDIQNAKNLVIELLKNDYKRFNMGGNGYKFNEDNLSWHKVGQKIMDFLIKKV